MKASGNLFIAVVGAGVLGLPYAFRQVKLRMKTSECAFSTLKHQSPQICSPCARPFLRPLLGRIPASLQLQMTKRLSVSHTISSTDVAPACCACPVRSAR